VWSVPAVNQISLAFALSVPDGPNWMMRDSGIFQLHKNFDASDIKPPPPIPPPLISLFINIFIAIWAAEDTASCLLAPWACAKALAAPPPDGNTTDEITYNIPGSALLIEELAGLCHGHADELILCTATRMHATALSKT